MNDARLDELMTQKELAAWFRVERTTIWRYKQAGFEMPKNRATPRQLIYWARKNAAKDGKSLEQSSASHPAT